MKHTSHPFLVPALLGFGAGLIVGKGAPWLLGAVIVWQLGRLIPPLWKRWGQWCYSRWVARQHDPPTEPQLRVLDGVVIDPFSAYGQRLLRQRDKHHQSQDAW